MNRSVGVFSIVALGGTLWLSGCGGAAETGGAQSFTIKNDTEAADYVVDPWWPETLPNNWAIGQVAGIAVDRHDHIWIIQRPGTITTREAGAEQNPPISECCVKAPPVIEFDQNGKVLRAWGGPGEGYEWPSPSAGHGIFVDGQDNVWLAGGEGEHAILKFTADGKFLLQIGQSRVTKGSNDTSHLGSPTNVFVDDTANEVYVADGYINRRVIVFDATTGAYKRHWGAYGKRPDDTVDDYDATDTGKASSQFRGPVHAIKLSRDGFVYVADRGDNRIQVFKKDGTFIKEGFVARSSIGGPRPKPSYQQGSLWALTLSVDPKQSYIYVADGADFKVWVLRRADLQVVGSFGSFGRNAGQFGWVHAIDMDSHGNIYTGEVDIYKRVQRFVPSRAVRAPARNQE